MQMNKAMFAGRVARAPHFRDGGRTPVCHVTLIANEYVGRDDTGDVRERRVAIPFTAFDARARAIADHVYVGDQLIVEYRVVNNDRDVDGDTEYGFSFVIEQFDFGAPGELKRQKLAEAAAS
jgi:single-strand DNA-binding protein